MKSGKLFHMNIPQVMSDEAIELTIAKIEANVHYPHIWCRKRVSCPSIVLSLILLVRYEKSLLDFWMQGQFGLQMAKTPKWAMFVLSHRVAIINFGQ